MPPLLISGLINLETTLQVEAFPVAYQPVRYLSGGVGATVSGVGFNLARALRTLGDEPRLLSLVGRDAPGELALSALRQAGLSAEGVLPAVERTPQSVILYEPGGRRQISVDLKDIQDQVYPREHFEPMAKDCQAALLCNINFSRPLLKWARERGILVATDVHTVASVSDPYNADFMAAADLLFMSDEALPEPPEDFARRVFERYGNRAIVVGLGDRGALLYEGSEDHLEQVPAVRTRPVVSTIGAGDALLAAFVHFYIQGLPGGRALRRAVVFASYKIGAAGAAEGFLTETELIEWSGRVWRE